MHHFITDLYGATVITLFSYGLCGMIYGGDCSDYPVQRPLARLWVMLSHGVLAYYGLIRDSRPSRCLIFFVQQVFALWPHFGWRREVPQFTLPIFSIVPPSVPRRSEQMHSTVTSLSTLAFALSARARLTHPIPAGSRMDSVTRLQSSLYGAARWIACPSPARTFTFKLAPLESPQQSVEYNYTGKQSIPVTGLSPVRYAALWAANR